MREAHEPHPIRVVYATVNAVLSTEIGLSRQVVMGQHWPATDPLVDANPSAFTEDPRFGLQWTGEPPAYMRLAPDAPREELLAAVAAEHGVDDDEPSSRRRRERSGRQERIPGDDL